MSSHPQIERFNESVKKSINNFLGVFDASIEGSFRNGFAKATIWTFLSLVAIALPIAIIQQLQPGNHWLENASRIALSILVSAFGQNLNLLGLTGVNSSVISVGAHPTLLTILVAIAAFRAGKSFSSNTSGSSDNGRSHRFSIGLGLGSSLSLLGATWILQGAFGWGNAFVSLSTSSLLDFLITFAIVAFAAWMGSKLNEGSSAKSSALGWARRATLNFVAIYSAILAVGVIVWIAYSLISPHFGPSQPVTKTDFKFDLGQMALVLIVILAYLPNFLFMFFSAGSGMSVGLDLHGTQGLDALLTSIQSYIPGGIPASFSITSTYGMILESLVLAVVAVAALIAGAAATKKTRYNPNKGFDFVQSLFITVVLGVFAAYLGNLSGSWNFPSDGKTIANTGTVSFGVVLASMALVLTLVVTFAWLAGAKATEGIENAFPRLVARMGSTTKIERTRKGWTVFGRLMTLLLAIGLIVYPIGSAVASRIWASIDTPAALGEKFASKLENGDIVALKALVGPNVNEDAWLPEAALKAALPATGSKHLVVVTNNQSKPWSVGNTDAKIHVSWKKDKATAVWPIGTSSKIETKLLLINHLVFNSKVTPVYLNLSVNASLSKDVATELKVNGVSVNPGTYAVLPGFYHITLPGVGLVAETDYTVATNGTDTGFVAGDFVNLPAGGSEQLNGVLETKANACQKISDSGNATCFSTSDVLSNKDDGTGTAPSSYFEAANTGFKLDSFKCDSKVVDALETVTSMTRTQSCAVSVSFTRNFYTYRIATVTVRVPYQYDACPYAPYYCWQTGYHSQTQSGKVRGAKIGSVTYKSEFSVPLTAKGTLKGTRFTAK